MQTIHYVQHNINKRFLLSKTHFVLHITHSDTLSMWHTLSCCNVTYTLKPNLSTLAFNYTELTKYPCVSLAKNLKKKKKNRKTNTTFVSKVDLFSLILSHFILSGAAVVTLSLEPRREPWGNRRPRRKWRYPLRDECYVRLIHRSRNTLNER